MFGGKYMKNIDKAKTLEKLYKYLKKNNLNITACGCCGGYHIEYNDDSLCEGTDIEDLKSGVKFYKENQNKISVLYKENPHTKIEFIRLGEKLLNLGGKSLPFDRYYKFYHRFRNMDELKEYILGK